MKFNVNQVNDQTYSALVSQISETYNDKYPQKACSHFYLHQYSSLMTGTSRD